MSNRTNPDEKKKEAAEKAKYNEMDMLERLETLREDMEDLDVTTLAEVIQRIEVLHQQLDM